MTDIEITKAKVAATIKANIARMQAALASAKPEQKVYCWNAYGLGVLTDQEGVSVVSIERATIIRKPSNVTYRNGANVPAVLMPRGEALQAAIASAQSTLAHFA